MSERKEQLQSLIQRLETERDELRMKVGLAKLEAREEWQELEGKLDRLRGRMKRLKDEAGEATDDIGDAFELLGDEIKEGYTRIRKLF